MKKQKLLLGAFCCLAGLLSACAGDDEGLTPGATGEGTLALNVQAQTSFQTKALDEAEYKDIDNYTVELYSGSELYRSWTPNEALPTTLKVPAGTYTLKAYYGEDVAASTEKMYVEGTSDPVTVSGDDTEQQTLSVTCEPTCAKVTVQFAPEMDDYFSDYSIDFHTIALGSSTFTWAKDATDPVYLKVNENETITAQIALVKSSDGTRSTLEKTYTLSPNTGKTIKVSPIANATGDVGISITIDDSTHDTEIDIEIPQEWI